MNIKEFKEFLPITFKVKVAVMLNGLHGIGKSQVVKQIAYENGMDFIDIRLSQIDATDLIGLPDVSGETTTYKQPSWLPRDPSSKGILFLDELFRGRKDVLQAVFQLVLDRRIGEYVLPEGWHVVSANNPSTEDYDVTDVSDEALLDRFLHIKLEPTKQEFFTYLKGKEDVEQSFVDYLQTHETMLENQKLAAADFKRKPSRRSNETAGKLLKIGLPENLMIEALAGLIGIESAVAYKTYLQDNETSPFKPEDILSGMKKIKDRVVKYADMETGRHDVLSVSLDNLRSHLEKNQGTKKQVDSMLVFLKLIPKDMTVGFLRGLGTSENQALVDFLVDMVLSHPEIDDVLGTPQVLPSGAKASE